MNTEREGEFAEVAKLRRVHAVDPAVLSLYLSVPLDPAQLRSLPVRASELMAAAGGPPRRLRTAWTATVAGSG